MTLSPKERKALVQAHAYIRSHGADFPPEAGPELADVLRRVLVDVSDVTVGRVLLHVAQYLRVLSEGNPTDVAAAVASDQLLLAALDLTALEWRDIDSS